MEAGILGYTYFDTDASCKVCGRRMQDRARFHAVRGRITRYAREGVNCYHDDCVG